jgi:Tol biopolymer transport system component
MRIKVSKAATLLILVAVFVGCKAENEKKTDSVNGLGAFMGMLETSTPRLLNPDLIASPLDEYNGTFSPDGDEFYFTTYSPGLGIISYTEMDDLGNWSQPRVADFSGEYSEYDPLFSPDGKRLYFSSERPVSSGAEEGKTNIWYIERTDSSWSAPNLVWLDSRSTYYSSMTSNGLIYFNIWDTGDMYKAIPNQNGHDIILLDSLLNTSKGEGDPFISPDESYLIYRGYNNSLGRGDLYISFNIDGKWTEPENLGAPINSEAHEMCPYVTTDGDFFIFASARINDEFESSSGAKLTEVREKFNSYDNGQLNIFYMSADFIDEMRKKHQ